MQLRRKVAQQNFAKMERVVSKKPPGTLSEHLNPKPETLNPLVTSLGASGFDVDMVGRAGFWSLSSWESKPPKKGPTVDGINPASP